MKIAIISANIGGIDEIYPPAKQTEDYEFFYYTENTLPFPLPNLDSRMKARYLKTQIHKYLDHDLFIWVDGSVEIVDGTFLTWVKQQIGRDDMIIMRHEERSNVFDELNYIIDAMRAGKGYLIKRRIKQPFKEEIEFYLKNLLPQKFPLYKTYFFACKNNEATNKTFDLWWDLTLRYSNFDQAALSYAAFYYWDSFKVNVVNAENYIKRHKHQ
jgi:hypothetical protein